MSRGNNQMPEIMFIASWMQTELKAGDVSGQKPKLMYLEELGCLQMVSSRIWRSSEAKNVKLDSKSKFEHLFQFFKI